jgi:septal ring factor EnvC (AmiA/AmiB activator)
MQSQEQAQAQKVQDQLRQQVQQQRLEILQLQKQVQQPQLLLQRLSARLANIAARTENLRNTKNGGAYIPLVNADNPTIPYGQYKLSLDSINPDSRHSTSRCASGRSLFSGQSSSVAVAHQPAI